MKKGIKITLSAITLAAIMAPLALASEVSHNVKLQEVTTEVAESLDMTVDELRGLIDSGEVTLKDLAEEAGIEFHGRPRVPKKIKELTEHIANALGMTTDEVVEQLKGSETTLHDLAEEAGLDLEELGFDQKQPKRIKAIKAVAEALGLSIKDLHEMLKEGDTTLEELANDAGIDLENLNPIHSRTEFNRKDRFED